MSAESNEQHDVPDSIAKLLASKWSMLERFVRSKASAIVAEHESTDDIVQSVCREVIERARDGRFELRSEKELDHFLFEAAEMKLGARHRHWLAQRRDAAREEPLAAGGSSTPNVNEPADRSEAAPSRVASAKEDLERLQDAIARLPERYREILQLSQIEGLTHAQIAERLGINEANSRALLARAVAKLSTEIGDEPPRP